MCYNMVIRLQGVTKIKTTEKIMRLRGRVLLIAPVLAILPGIANLI